MQSVIIESVRILKELFNESSIKIGLNVLNAKEKNKLDGTIHRLFKNEPWIVKAWKEDPCYQSLTNGWTGWTREKESELNKEIDDLFRDMNDIREINCLVLLHVQYVRWLNP